MAHRRNEDFYLYTAFSPTGSDSYAAYEHMKSTGIFFKHLHYGDPTQIDDVLEAIKSWKDGLNDLNFPFVVYTQVYDPQEEPNRLPFVVNGLQDIQSVDWNETYNFSG